MSGPAWMFFEGRAQDWQDWQDWQDVAPEPDVAIWEKYEYLIAAWWGNHTRAVDETVVRMHTTHREVERVLDDKFQYEYDHGLIVLGDK